MEAGEEFPFGTGQRVESKSNIKGFRGAWFRSEIKYIQIRRGEIWCAMHYMDFPDEKTNFMKAYQQDVSGKKKRVLMVRPSYPLVCMGNDESVINAATGSVVVVNGDWWVGDLVDWFTDGCFWAARITAVMSKDLVKVELPSAPIGEGGSYEAAVKDIRPSLDWSVEQLWTVPSAKSRANIQKMDESSSSLTSPIDASGILDKNHIFIAKQEPVRTTVVQGFNNTFTGREEAQMKRKFSYLLPERNKVSDVRPSNSPLKAPGPFSMRAVKDSAMVNPATQISGVFTGLMDAFSMHNKPLQAKASPTDLAGKQGSEASFHRNQQQGHNVETDGCTEAQRSVPQIDATDNAISEQHTFGSSNTPNDRGEVSLFKEFNILLGEGKCLDLSDERIGSSIVALEELVSRVAWLKGVMQLGLKGWCREVKKRKWMFCEREVPPVNKSQQDVELTHYLRPGPGNSLSQAQPGGACLFAFHNSG